MPNCPSMIKTTEFKSQKDRVVTASKPSNHCLHKEWAKKLRSHEVWTSSSVRKVAQRTRDQENRGFQEEKKFKTPKNKGFN